MACYARGPLSALPRRRRSVALNDRFPRLERPLVAAVAAFRSCPIPIDDPKRFRQASISLTNEPPPLDPLEAGIGA